MGVVDSRGMVIISITSAPPATNAEIGYTQFYRESMNVLPLYYLLDDFLPNVNGETVQYFPLVCLFLLRSIVLLFTCPYQYNPCKHVVHFLIISNYHCMPFASIDFRFHNLYMFSRIFNSVFIPMFVRGIVLVHEL